MAKYQFRWNGYNQVYLPPEGIGTLAPIVSPWIYGMMVNIQPYRMPLEEKELVLDEVPAPDYAAILRDSDK